MFPERRMRRYRRPGIRRLLAETHLRPEQLIAPLFVDETIRRPAPIPTLPGQDRLSLASLPHVAGELRDLGIPAVLLFGIPAHKDAEATSAFDSDGIIPRALHAIRDEVPDLTLITDVCACEYTDHGHCGILGEVKGRIEVLNDESLALMERIALSHADAGADIVAPSCMLDGVVTILRDALDDGGHDDVLIMSYSSKFASSLYGPFREAADSGCQSGDRSGYQLPVGNAREALMESALDAAEGADILMVKPAGYYLDLIPALRVHGLPVAAFQVSGEYAMIRAAAAQGWLPEREAVLETLTCIRRAGADLIITYFARLAAGWLREEQ
jgi:porphobilinogen synthase